ncbi:auxin-responsive protein IAA13-like [Malania oleifera]|uniref:auxin-responsive protein IAA13-like n=1 Tax=Malania oleifera TaxID=397392 RepID=UPI0025AEAFE6|nr:auxin-responsive protein IAA13-like [Malania oleifera]
MEVPNKASTSSVAAISGTKRAADSVAKEVVAAAGVVGWPLIRAYRMNNLANQAKTLTSKEDETCKDNKLKDTSKKKVYNGSNKNNTAAMEKGHLGFVKVNMDGLLIGRKVDLNAHACYETLAQALEDMFVNPTTGITSICLSGQSEQARKASKLLNGSFKFVLTYEDKEGDWILVGDVPWEMYLNTVKRLSIMKTLEANGVAPRFQETNGRKRREAFVLDHLSPCEADGELSCMKSLDESELAMWVHPPPPHREACLAGMTSTGWLQIQMGRLPVYWKGPQYRRMNTYSSCTTGGEKAILDG